MTASVTRGKSAAECGYTAPDPRDALAELRQHLGLAEGHLAALHRLIREIDHGLDITPDPALDLAPGPTAATLLRSRPQAA